MMSKQSGSLATIVLASILFVGIVSVILFLILDAVRVRPTTQQSAIVESGSEDTYTGSPVEPPIEIPDFALTAHTGETFHFSELRGRVVLLFFGFTHCPDFCPTTLADFVAIKNALGEQAAEVAFVFISVDGARDTPEILAAYLSHFDNSFIGLTGTEDEVLTIGEPFGLTVVRTEIDSALGYTIDHTVATFLIDREGRLVRRFSYGTAPAVVTEQVRNVLNGGNS
jgi:protein SCO1/2